MYKLHYFPGNASFAPHVIINEAGAEVELVLVDRTKNAQKDPKYLKINPAGRIPTLIDSDLVLFESAAICMHLTDKHPGAGLAPPLGTHARAHFYKWMMYFTNSIQPDVMIFHYTARYTTNEVGVPEMKFRADQRIQHWFDIVEENMETGPYLLGNTYSAADIYLTMLCRWGRLQNPKPASRPKIGKLVDLVLARPAVQKTIKAEGIEGSFLG
jgi:glutathione S-transferase